MKVTVGAGLSMVEVGWGKPFGGAVFAFAGDPAPGGGQLVVGAAAHIGASSRSIDGYIRECMAAPYRLGLTAIRSHTATARDDQSTTNRRLTQVFGLQYQVGHQGLVFEVRLVLNGVP